MNDLDATSDSSISGATPQPSETGTVDIVGLLTILAPHRRRIAISAILGLMIGVGIAFLLRPVFTATASILPPQQQQSSLTAMMGQLGALTGMGGGGSGGLLKNPADMYIGFLQSRTITDRIIDKFQMSNVYHLKSRENTRRVLQGNTRFDATKDGLIQIVVQDHSAIRASDLANAYIDELYELNSTLAISEAAQRRAFFDRQVDEEKKALAFAEDDLKSTQQKTGIIELSGQSQLILRNIAQIRAEIASREVQLQAMRTFATDQNPEVTRTEQEIATLRQQLAGLESDQARVRPGDTEVSSGQVPAASIEYIRKLREVRYHETLFELLSKQYEAARIDEAKSAPIIQVVDHAVPPELKSGPPRLLIVVGCGFLGFLLAAGWQFAHRSLVRYRRIPANAMRFEELRNALKAQK